MPASGRRTNGGEMLKALAATEDALVSNEPGKIHRGNSMKNPNDTTLAGGSRRMGNTGLVISRLGYGAMELSGPPEARTIDELDACKFLNQVIDLGINYIDTSIDYGLSESLIGKALSHRRSDLILASKCGCRVGREGPGRGGESHIYTGENVTAGVGAESAPT